MTDLAIRVENCILSGVEGLSKLYPSTLLRACPECNEGAGHIGRGQQRHDTTSTRLSAGLHDALTDFLPRITRISRKDNSSNSWQETSYV
jgi:hypothetical protein